MITLYTIPIHVHVRTYRVLRNLTTRSSVKLFVACGRTLRTIPRRSTSVNKCHIIHLYLHSTYLIGKMDMLLVDPYLQNQNSMVFFMFCSFFLFLIFYVSEYFYVGGQKIVNCLFCVLTYLFVGNSTSAILDGVATLSLLTLGEDYTMSMPYAHVKGT